MPAPVDLLPEPSLNRRIAPSCPGARVKASPSSLPVQCSPDAALRMRLPREPLRHVIWSLFMRRDGSEEQIASTSDKRRSHEHHDHPYPQQHQRGAVPRPRDSPKSRAQLPFAGSPCSSINGDLPTTAARWWAPSIYSTVPLRTRPTATLSVSRGDRRMRGRKRLNTIPDVETSIAIEYKFAAPSELIDSAHK